MHTLGWHFEVLTKAGHSTPSHTRRCISGAKRLSFLGFLEIFISGVWRFVSRAPRDFDLGRERVATFYTLFPLSARDHLSEPSDILGPYFLGSLPRGALRGALEAARELLERPRELLRSHRELLRATRRAISRATREDCESDEESYRERRGDDI